MDSRRAFNGANAKGSPPERAAFLISISSSAYAIANFVFQQSRRELLSLVKA
jgi:hypothetical protein